MYSKEGVKIRLATINDVDELLRLYFLIYGNSYPLPLGTDKNIMTEMIESDECYWIVSECVETNIIAGSAVIVIKEGSTTWM
ncbi:MAG: hypothetical protein SNJ53_03775 [Thermodesulfovibrionales bacterium]